MDIMRQKKLYVKNLFIVSFILLVSLGCVLSQQPAPVVLEPTIDPASLKSQINIRDSSTWTWNEIPAPVFNPRYQHNPQMVVGLDGRLHLFWDTLSLSGNAFIYHSYLQNGTWSNPSPVAMSLGSSDIFEKPIVGLDGTIHVIWYNKLKLGGPYRLLYSKFDGTKWGTEDEIYTSEKDPNLSGQLFLDSQGGVHAIVKSPVGANSDIFYMTQTSDGWDTPKSIMPVMGIDGLVSWKFFPDNQGNVRFYGKDLGSKLRYSYWHDGTLDAVVKTNIQLPMADSYFVDAKGNYYIYWTGQVPVPGGVTTGAYYQCINSDLISWPELVLSGEQNIITRPLVAQSESNLVLSWLAKGNKINFLFPGSCENADLFTFDMTDAKQPRNSLDIVVSDNPQELCYLNQLSIGKYEIYCTDMK